MIKHMGVLCIANDNPRLTLVLSAKSFMFKCFGNLKEMAKQVTTRQLELLLDFLEQHQSLALGRVRGKEGNALATRLWAQCANILNADVGGVQKSAQDWKKYYNQYKSRTKAKQRQIKNSLYKTGGGPAEINNLTPLEDRLIGILGGCSSPLPVRHNPLDALTIELARGESNVGDNAIASTSAAIDHEADPNYLEETTDYFVIPNDNIQVVSDAAGPPPDNQTENEETEVEKKGAKMPLSCRKINVGPSKRRRRRRSSSPKINKEFELAEQRLASIEQSRIEVDREMTQAIHRLASSMEEIASAIKSVGAAFSLNFKRNKRRNTRISSDSSSTSSHADNL